MQMNLEYNNISLLDAIINGLPMGYGNTMYFTYGEVKTGSYAGSLRDLYLSDDLKAGSTVSVIIIPIVPGKLESDYTVDDIIFRDVKLADYTFDGTATVNFGTPNVSYNFISLPISSNAKRVYYAILETEEYKTTKEEMSMTGDFVEVLMQYYLDSMKQTEESVTASFSNDLWFTPLLPNKSYTVFGFAVEASGAVGNICEATVTTTDLPYSDNMSITAINASSENGNTDVQLTVTGTPAKLYWKISVSSYAPTPGRQGETILDAVESWMEVYIDQNNFSDGTISLKNLSGVGNNNAFKFSAFVVDEEGNFSEICASAEYKTVLTTEAGLKDLLPDKGTPTLGADITLTAPLSVTKNITLDLGGYTLTAPEDGVAFTVGSGMTLTIKNGAVTGTVYPFGGDGNVVTDNTVTVTPSSNQ